MLNCVVVAFGCSCPPELNTLKDTGGTCNVTRIVLEVLAAGIDILPPVNEDINAWKVATGSDDKGWFCYD